MATGTAHHPIPYFPISWAMEFACVPRLFVRPHKFCEKKGRKGKLGNKTGHWEAFWIDTQHCLIEAIKSIYIFRSVCVWYGPSGGKCSDVPLHLFFYSWRGDNQATLANCSHLNLKLIVSDRQTKWPTWSFFIIFFFIIFFNVFFFEAQKTCQKTDEWTESLA